MDLLNYRKQIDNLDEKILSLINERLKLSEKISQEKKKIGKEIFDKIREKEVLLTLKNKNTGPASEELIETIFRKIMNASKCLQHLN